MRAKGKVGVEAGFHVSDSPEELHFSLKSHSVGSSNLNANSKYNSYEVCSRNPFS